MYVNKNTNKTIPTLDKFDDLTHHSQIKLKTKNLIMCVEALETSFAPQAYYFNESTLNSEEQQWWMNEDHYKDIEF